MFGYYVRRPQTQNEMKQTMGFLNSEFSTLVKIRAKRKHLPSMTPIDDEDTSLKKIRSRRR